VLDYTKTTTEISAVLGTEALQHKKPSR